MKKLTASSLAPLSLLAFCFSLGFQGCTATVVPLIDGGFDSGTVVDSGTDSGTVIDGGPDAGDAGMDAGLDAGLDAGPDAGPDAGDAGPKPPQFGTPTVTPVAASVGQLATGDFNADGKLDLVVSLGAPDSDFSQSIRFSGVGVEVLTGAGSGGFYNPVELFTGSAPQGVAVLDINGDGLPDIAVGVCQGGSGHISYFLNAGVDAGFGARHDVTVGMCPYSLAVVADLSGPGLAGLASAGPGPFEAGNGAGEVDLLVSIDGGLQVGQTLTTPTTATAVLAADLNADGVADLAATTSTGDGPGNSQLVVWLGADGGFSSPTSSDLDHGPYRAMASGDIDGNGAPDIALAGFYSGTLTLMLGHGDGSFGAPIYQDVAGAVQGVVMGDFGNNGVVDVAVSTYTTPFLGVSVFQGGGPASSPLGPELRILSDGYGYGLASGDFNGDGLLDLVASLGDRSAVGVIPGLNHPPFLPDPDTYAPAPHIPVPPVGYNGGPVLESPQIVTVTYANDVNGLLDEQFDAWVVGSDWFSQVGADYGVSNGNNVNVVLPGSAPTALTDTDIQFILYGLVDAGTVPPPYVADGGRVAQQVYFMYYPYGTTISGQNLGTSCQSFGAYHSEDDLYTTPFAYAVIPTCDPRDPYLTEVSASHELAEAASDPLVQTFPAYTNASYNNGWIGEIGDVCTPFDIGYQLDGGTYYVVQRIWSNSAADAGLQPCIPADIVPPYTNVSPVADNSVQIICDTTSPDTCASVYFVAAGQTFNIDITGWVSAPSVAPGVAAVPFFVAGLIPASFAPTVTQDTYNLHNGEVGHLTVSVPSNAPSMSIGVFTVLSGLDNDNYAYWPIVVYVQ